MAMNNRETTPEQRLDLVVCDQQTYPAADAAEQYYQNGHYNHHDHPGVIRPIPGRPGGGGGRYQNGPPPVPGPKPVLNYLKNDQYNNNNGGPAYDPHYNRKDLNGVQRQLFPPPVNHCEVYNVHEVTSNGKLGGINSGVAKHNFGPFSYTNGFTNGFTNGYPRPTSNLKPMRKLKVELN